MAQTESADRGGSVMIPCTLCGNNPASGYICIRKSWGSLEKKQVILYLSTSGSGREEDTITPGPRSVCDYSGGAPLSKSADRSPVISPFRASSIHRFMRR